MGMQMSTEYYLDLRFPYDINVVSECDNNVKKYNNRTIAEYRQQVLQESYYVFTVPNREEMILARQRADAIKFKYPECFL
jgi:hypothetical protein